MVYNKSTWGTTTSYIHIEFPRKSQVKDQYIKLYTNGQSSAIVDIIYCLIAVCTFRLVMISIERSETAPKKCTGNPRQNVVQDKIQSENFFFDGWKKSFFWTEFCLGLHTAVVFRIQSFKYVIVIVLEEI